jgi:hypothetical protein
MSIPCLKSKENEATWGRGKPERQKI